jgi:hypothetical protein
LRGIFLKGALGTFFCGNADEKLLKYLFSQTDGNRWDKGREHRAALTFFDF